MKPNKTYFTLRTIRMPTFQYPRSFPRFPTVLPQLLECLEADKLVPVQFLRGGRVRLTFRDPEVCEEVVRGGLDFDGLPIFARRQLTIDSVMWLRDLLVVIANETVSSFFSDYGLVKSSGWITAALTISPLCVMVIVLWKSCSPRRFRSLSVLKVATAVCGILVSLLNVSFISSLAIAPQPVLSLVCAGAVVSPAIWPGSAPKLGHSSLCFCHRGFALWTTCFIWLRYGWRVFCFGLCSCLLCSWPRSCSTCSCYPVTAPAPVILLLLFLLLFLLLLLLRL